ncbi:hypothetical protein [Ideonella paludis]|uniref:hypothetical protein n=1 Tax=Ideonella paludis TaxID=1233411 RepID=UPI003628E6E4
MIHPTAVISAHAAIDPTAEIGPWCVIDGPVQIGPRTVLMNGVAVYGDVRIGADNHIGAHTAIGGRPQGRLTKTSPRGSKLVTAIRFLSTSPSIAARCGATAAPVSAMTIW